MAEEREINKIVDNSLVKFGIVNEPVDYKTDDRFRQLGNRSFAQESGLLQYIPQIAAAEALNGTYRVEFPKGVAGVLMKHGNGVLSAMQGENGRIVGHATFIENGMELPTLLGVFSALSMITSQYFLTQIYSDLEEIQDKLNQILDFLYTEKACEIYSEVQAVRAIYTNFVSIMWCQEQRMASICTIQHAKAIAEKNIQFYCHDMNRKIAYKKEDKGLRLPEIKLPDIMDGLGVDDKIEMLACELLDDLNSYSQSINLYSICSILEIVMSQNFSAAYLDYVEQDLKEHFKNHNIMIAKMDGKIAFLSNKKAGKELLSVVKSMQSLLGEDSPEKKFSGILDQIRDTYNSKTEYRILDDGTVYQKIY